jgi:hypothetical protein
LTKKIQRQSLCVVMKPPRVGPITGPAITIAPKKPCAAACSSRGKVSYKKAWALAKRPPPIKPCNTRAPISIGKLVDRPHSTEATVKPISENTK